jgi:hypothetical protein
MHHHTPAYHQVHHQQHHPPAYTIPPGPLPTTPHTSILHHTTRSITNNTTPAYTSILDILSVTAVYMITYTLSIDNKKGPVLLAARETTAININRLYQYC